MFGMPALEQCSELAGRCSEQPDRELQLRRHHELLRQLQLLSISHGSIEFDPVADEEDIPTRQDLPSTKRGEPSAPELGARYATGAEIARGGMGRVVEASDTLL